MLEKENGDNGDEDQAPLSYPPSQRCVTCPLPSATRLERRPRPNLPSLLPKLYLQLSTPRVNGNHLPDDKNNNMYTSLRDILQQSPTVQSPSRHLPDDIQIKNPLLKQAAYAYLQPKFSPTPTKDWRWFGRERTVGEDSSDGCVGFISHILSAIHKICSGGVDDSTTAAMGATHRND